MRRPVLMVMALLFAIPQPLFGQQNWGGPSSSQQSPPQNNAVVELSKQIGPAEAELRGYEDGLGMFEQMGAKVGSMAFTKGQLESKFDEVQKAIASLTQSGDGKDPQTDPSKWDATQVRACLGAIQRFREAVVQSFKVLQEKNEIAINEGRMSMSVAASFSGNGYSSAEAESVRVGRTKRTSGEDVWNDLIHNCDGKCLVAIDQIGWILNSPESAKGNQGFEQARAVISGCKWTDVETELDGLFDAMKASVQEMISGTISRLKRKIQTLKLSLDDLKASRQSVLEFIKNDQLTSWARFWIFFLLCAVVVWLTRPFWLPLSRDLEKYRAADVGASEATSTNKEKSDVRENRNVAPSNLDLILSGSFVQVFALVVVLLTIAILGVNRTLEWQTVGTMLGTIVGYAFGRATVGR